jgi:hypothetical protein
MTEVLLAILEDHSVTLNGVNRVAHQYRMMEKGRRSMASTCSMLIQQEDCFLNAVFEHSGIVGSWPERSPSPHHAEQGSRR